MPYAHSPMPIALCRIVPHLSEKGYIYFSPVFLLDSLIPSLVSYITFPHLSQTANQPSAQADTHVRGRFTKNS